MAQKATSRHTHYADKHEVEVNTLVRDTEWGHETYQTVKVDDEHVHFDNGEKVGHADLVNALDNHLEIVGTRSTR